MISRPLRILIAHQVPNNRGGGMSRIMGFIHDQLVSAGHTVDYLCAEALPAYWPRRTARFVFPWLVRQRAVAARRAGRPYDLINVHEPSSAAIAIAPAAAGRAVLVVTSHGVEQRGWEQALAERRYGRAAPSWKTRIVYPLTSLWQSRLGLARADHIFCLNFEDRDYLVNWLCCPRERITRIYPAANPLYAQAAQGRAYARCERLLFAGTWIKRKGTADLVQAFTVLAGRHPALRLIVLGGGASPEQVRAEFPAAMRARVECVQTTNETENAAAFAAADLYLLPSLFEGTPLTLIEAMMSGLPIVTTAICGMKDVIRDGENGLLIPVRAPEAIVVAVERLLDDERLRAQLGLTAQTEALRRYTWEQVATPVREVYEQLCQRRER